MNVSQKVESVNTGEHFSNVKPSMPVMENTGIVQKGAEITSGDIFHSKIDLIVVLEGVEQFHEPLTFGRSENIPFGQNVSDLVQLEQQLLAHDLQRAHFTSVLLLSKENLTIPTLSNLGQNVEISMVKACAALAEMRSLSAKIFLQRRLIFGGRGSRRGRITSFKLCLTRLTIVHIAEKVKVVVEEIYRLSADA